MCGPVWPSQGGYAAVTAHDVYAQLGARQGGTSGPVFGPELHVPVGNVILYPDTYAIRFRNYSPGQVAVVSAALFSKAEAVLTLTSGGVSAPASATNVTRIAQFVGSGAAIDFPNIPATYSHLLIIGQVHVTPASGFTLELTLNNDTGANYHTQLATGNAGTPGAAETLAGTSVPVNVSNSNYGKGNFMLVIPNYSLQGSGGAANAFMVLGLAGDISAGWASSGSLSARNVVGWWQAGGGTVINRVSMFPSAGSFIESNVTIYGIP